jgi:hypothetical protein
MIYDGLSLGYTAGELTQPRDSKPGQFALYYTIERGQKRSDVGLTMRKPDFRRLEFSFSPVFLLCSTTGYKWFTQKLQVAE